MCFKENKHVRIYRVLAAGLSDNILDFKMMATKIVTVLKNYKIVHE